MDIMTNKKLRKKLFKRMDRQMLMIPEELAENYNQDEHQDSEPDSIADIFMQNGHPELSGADAELARKIFGLKSDSRLFGFSFEQH